MDNNESFVVLRKILNLALALQHMKPERFWEIDFLRGIAIVMMVIFHILYDLDFFGLIKVNISSGFWFFFARATATLFITLVGISLTLSYSKDPKFSKFAKRGAIIFSYGLAITLATWLLAREGTIFFGVLHFIGLAIILAYPLIKFKYAALISGIAAIAIGFVLKSLTFSFDWLMWLGLKPSHFYAYDYFPIFPWFGLVLIGIFLGNTFYKSHDRQFELANQAKLTKPVCFLGRHSLLIYLLHQPIVILLLYVTKLLI